MICSLGGFRQLATFLRNLFSMFFQNHNFLHDLFPLCFLLASNFLHDLFPVFFQNGNFLHDLFPVGFGV